MRSTLTIAFALLGIAAAAAPARPAAPPEKPATELGVKGTSFTLNGRPTFLLGVSYYAGLGAPEGATRKDLADAKEYGFNWVRVWATWAAFGNDVSAVDAEGRPREEFVKKLRRLVAECDAKGVVVDVTLSRGTDPARLGALAAHRRAVEAVVAALKGHRNWYLDLGNERNIGDKRFVSFEDLKELRALARKLDPALLVTASHGGDISKEEFRKYMKAGVDFVSPHRPRGADSPGQTEGKTKEYLGWGKELGREVPVHYQEPFRRGYAEWGPEAGDFAADLKGARAGGAAGWCFHNGGERSAKDGRPRRSFDLREKRLFEQLDAEEVKALRLLK
jgi:hypothetical protein